MTEQSLEKIGFHKGCLTTLSKEREELLKMVHVVEQLMRLHVDALKAEGVDLQTGEVKADLETKTKK